MALKAGYKGIKKPFMLQLKKLASAVTIGGESKSTVDDAISALAAVTSANTSKLTPGTATLTISENENYSLSGTVHVVRKFGNICELYSQFKCLTTDAATTTLNGDIPKPGNDEGVFIDVYPNGANDTPINVQITATYGLRISGGKANKYYNVHVVYLCKDPAPAPSTEVSPAPADDNRSVEPATDPEQEVIKATKTNKKTTK